MDRMENGPDKKRWYQQPLPLPRWLPGWLVTTLLAGLGFAGACWLGLHDLTWYGATIAFLCGAGLILVILSFTAVKVGNAQESPGFLPPLWIRLPVLMAVVVFVSLIWVTDRRVTTGSRHGGSHVIAEGPAAVAIGFVCMTAAGAVCVLMLRSQPRSGTRIAGASIAMAIVAAGLIYAFVHVLQMTRDV